MRIHFILNKYHLWFSSIQKLGSYKASFLLLCGVVTDYNFMHCVLINIEL